MIHCITRVIRCMQNRIHPWTRPYCAMHMARHILLRPHGTHLLCDACQVHTAHDSFGSFHWAGCIAVAHYSGTRDPTINGLVRFRRARFLARKKTAALLRRPPPPLIQRPRRLHVGRKPPAHFSSFQPVFLPLPPPSLARDGHATRTQHVRLCSLQAASDVSGLNEAGFWRRITPTSACPHANEASHLNPSRPHTRPRTHTSGPR